MHLHQYRRPLLAVLVAVFALAGCDGGTAAIDTTQPGDVVDARSDGGDSMPDVPGDLSEQDVPVVPDVADVPAGPDATDVPVDAPHGDEAPDVPVGPPYRVSESFDARGSIEQVHVRKATPGTLLQVVDADGSVVAEAAVDELGSLIFRGVTPARGYSVRPADDPDDYTGPLEILSVEGSLPDESFYASQVLEPGFGYLKVRDGTLLSYFLTLPGPPEDGPYPTVISYSGYSPSRPGRVLSPDVEPFCEIYPTLCNAPDDPSNMIAALLGFATVGINMRGTGCSDGGYDYFEPLQILDGYDVVEIVGRQPWVKGNKVGMVGISFPGISQLFVAAARPPSLAAIAPQSVIADSATSCLVPGGIYNDGFAREWHEMVLHRARPWDPGWVRDVIASGDTLCDEHQRMHGQQRDAITEALDHLFYTDEIARPMDPSAWVDQIQVPVFITGMWQDEQTGPHFAALFDRFTGSPSVRFVVTNGFHNDSASPQALADWVAFLFLFVAGEVPNVDPAFKSLGSFFMQEMFGAMIPFPDSIYESAPNLETALAMWHQEAPLRVIFESGTAKGVAAGAPQGAFEQRFASWPIPGTVAARWYLQPGGALLPDLPGEEGAGSAFVHDPAAGQRGTLSGGSVYKLPPNWNWRQPAEGAVVAFSTPPLEQDMVMVGHGSVDLWIRTDASDVDLEANLIEVRPDGNETLVQSGWLRASHRALRDDAAELRPIHSHREEDVQPFPSGEWVPVRIEIMPFGHVFRAGSRIRILVDTPGDSTTRWRFRLLEYDTPPTIEVAHHADHPSSVALPWVPAVQVPTPLPACGAVRGQPCRVHVPVPGGG
jgi:hypothetical protein